MSTSFSYVAVFDGKKKTEQILQTKDKKVHYMKKVDDKVVKEINDVKKIKEFLLKEKTLKKNSKKTKQKQ
jgi:hypothetical protein